MAASDRRRTLAPITDHPMSGGSGCAVNGTPGIGNQTTKAPVGRQRHRHRRDVHGDLRYHLLMSRKRSKPYPSYALEIFGAQDCVRFTSQRRQQQPVTAEQRNLLLRIYFVVGQTACACTMSRRRSANVQVRGLQNIRPRRMGYLRSATFALFERPPRSIGERFPRALQLVRFACSAICSSGYKPLCLYSTYIAQMCLNSHRERRSQTCGKIGQAAQWSGLEECEGRHVMGRHARHLPFWRQRGADVLISM